MMAFSRGKKPNCPYVEDSCSKINPLVLNMNLSKKKVPSVSKILWQGKMFLFCIGEFDERQLEQNLSLYLIVHSGRKKKAAVQSIYIIHHTSASASCSFFRTKSHTCHNQATSKDSSYYCCCVNQALSKHVPCCPKNPQRPCFKRKFTCTCY